MKHISHEHVSDYVDAVHEIEKNGYILDGMVIDGIQSLFKVFVNYKIQMCHYHMCAIVRRKITKKSKTSCRTGTSAIDAYSEKC